VFETKWGHSNLHTSSLQGLSFGAACVDETLILWSVIFFYHYSVYDSLNFESSSFLPTPSISIMKIAYVIEFGRKHSFVLSACIVVSYILVVASIVIHIDLESRGKGLN
jgi:hypothetical protein